MVRDSRMRTLITNEPITPFIYRVTSLTAQLQISTIVVIGGCGDWFDVHDTAIMLDNYKCVDVTKRAMGISKTFCTGRVQYNGRGLVHRLPWPRPVPSRYPDLQSLFDSTIGRVSVTNNGGFGILFGNSLSIDLSKFEQRIPLESGSLGIAMGIRWISNLLIVTNFQLECEADMPEGKKKRSEKLCNSPKRQKTLKLVDESQSACINHTDSMSVKWSFLALIQMFQRHVDEIGWFHFVDEMLEVEIRDSRLPNAKDLRNKMFSRPSSFELAFAMNRLRGLHFTKESCT